MRSSWLSSGKQKHFQNITVGINNDIVRQLAGVTAKYGDGILSNTRAQAHVYQICTYSVEFMGVSIIIFKLHATTNLH